MLTDAAQTQGRNIRTYADYLAQRSASYGGTKVDYVRSGEGRLKGLSVERGLLRETESVQDQLRALFKCDVGLHVPSLMVLTVQFLSHEPENEITLTAFRLLILDLLSLFYVMNEGTINILGTKSTSDWPKLTVQNISLSSQDPTQNEP